jgi:hypothetical protein
MSPDQAELLMSEATKVVDGLLGNENIRTLGDYRRAMIGLAAQNIRLEAKLLILEQRFDQLTELTSS